MRMFFALRWISVCVASTCSTSLVPMPCASAPKAPCVEVWLSPQTMVMPGRVKPCSGPMMWTMPWRRSSSLKYSMPKSRGVLGERLDLQPRFRIGDAVAAVGGRHVVVDDGERLLRRAHLSMRHAQALEGLRARHLVHEVAVDIEEAGAVGLVVDHVVVPDLVVEGFRFHGVWLEWLGSPGRSARRARPRNQRRRSEPSEAKRRAKKRAGSRAWSPIAAKAIVECAIVPRSAGRRAVLPGLVSCGAI